MAVERTDWSVHLSFSELVEITKEFKNMGTTASGKREWWSVVFQVLTKSVPVSALLVLVAAGG